MEVRGVVISVELDVQVAKAAGGTYPGARLMYRDEAGALKEKSFHNNVFKFNPGLKTQISNLNAGQSFVMTMEKEGEFWNVKSIIPAEANKVDTKQTNEQASKTGPIASPKSTYETAEERAKKQVYIVRQSSIGHAIELAKHNSPKGNSSFTEVLELAKIFENYVFDNQVEQENEIV
jgi:hypothetical protein